MRKISVVLYLIILITFNCKARGQKDDKYQKTGDAFMAVNDFNSALENYNKAIKRADDDTTGAKLYCKRAICYLALHQYDLCMKDCNKSIEINPNDGYAYFTRARCYDGETLLLQAINNYNKVMVLLPANDYKSRALMYSDIAIDYTSLRYYDEAMRNDSLSISTYPQFAKAYWLMGLINTQLKKYQLAIMGYTSALMYMNENDDDKSLIAGMYSDRAKAKVMLKQYKDAINDYTRSIMLNPGNQLVYWDRAAAYDKNTDYNLAIQDYTNAIVMYKGNSKALSILYSNKANDEMKLCLFTNTLHDDSVALNLNSLDDTPYWDMAAANHQLGNYLLSDSIYNKYSHLMGKYAPAQITASIETLIAGNELFLKQYDSVVTHCSDAIKKDNTDCTAYFYRGKTYYEKLNKPDLGIKDLNTVLTLDSTQKTSCYLFALFYLGRGSEAIDIMKNEILNTTNDSKLIADYYDLSCLYSMMNKPDEANIYLKKAIDNGYAKKYAMTDEDLDNIRNTDDYKNTIAGAMH